MTSVTLPLFLLSSAGMILVAIAAVAYWRGVTSLPFRWFGLGAALWFVAVAIKVAIAAFVHWPVVSFLSERLPYHAKLFAVGVYGGLLSSLCEIGLTLLAVLIWRRMGDDPDRAIGVGLGAGAIEAFLFGAAGMLAVLVAMTGIPEVEALRKQYESAARTPFFWLLPTVERVIAILCHASSRALVILGVVHSRVWMILGGFAIFSYIDGVVTAYWATNNPAAISLWWVELAIAPAAILSVPILRWCYSTWGRANQAARAPLAGASQAL